LHSLMRLLRGASVHQLVTYHQLVQHLHLPLAVRRNSLARSLVRLQRPALVPAPRHMTGRRRRNRSGMEPPGLAPTRVRTGQSIRASTPTLASMDQSIEPEGNAPYAGRRVNEPKRSLLRDLT
jgi:hypothetical protein